VRFLPGRSLRIEASTIHGFSGAAVDAEPTADGGTVTIAGSRLRDNCTAGLLARRSAGSVAATISDSFITNNRTGVLAGTGSTVRLTGNTIVGNTTGLASETGGVLGRVRHRPRKARRANRIYAQTTRAGTYRRRDAPIGVTVSASPVARAAVAGGSSRTWISTLGDDVNPCSRTAPCATFARALAVTGDGGSIRVLDSGDFGPITVDAPVTIDGGFNDAGISVAAGDTGITVDAPAGSDITLRGLTIINPASCTAAGGGDGIRVLSSGVLHLEDVAVRGFAGSGVSMAPGSTSREPCRAGSSAGTAQPESR
jgi:hypothetical protein